MNTSARSILRLSMVSTLLALGMTAWSGATAAEPEARSIHVRLSDLDLTTTDGRQVAYDRLRDAARTVCIRVSDAEDVGNSIHIAACMDRVMAKTGAVLVQQVPRSEPVQVATTHGR
jgi:UrcA family protein